MSLPRWHMTFNDVEGSYGMCCSYFNYPYLFTGHHKGSRKILTSQMKSDWCMTSNIQVRQIPRSNVVDIQKATRSMQYGIMPLCFHTCHAIQKPQTLKQNILLSSVFVFRSISRSQFEKVSIDRIYITYENICSYLIFFYFPKKIYENSY